MTSTQSNGQPNQNGHTNGHVIQQPKPPSFVGEDVGTVINHDEEQCSLKSTTSHLHSPSSSSSDSSGFFTGENGHDPMYINGSQEPPTLNMPPVDVDVDASTATNATASDSAALVPSSSNVISTSSMSPITPTPSSVFVMSHQLRQSDPPTSVEEPSPVESSDTPKVFGDVFSSAWVLKEGQKENQQGTKITIPEQPLFFNNTSKNPTPTSSRPASTSIDTTLFSNRPAPPSPSLSRRVSGVPSIGSGTYSNPNSNCNSPRSSRRPSMRLSRGGFRMSGVGIDAKRQSLGIGGGFTTPMSPSSPLSSPPPHKLSFTQSQDADAQASTTNTTTSTSTELSINPELPTPMITPTAATSFSPSAPEPQPSSSSTPLSARVYIKVRDFAYSPTDKRHSGLGDDTPKANRVNRLNRKLGGPDRARARDRARAAAAAALDPSSSSSIKSRRPDSIGSVDSSDADAEDEEDEEEDGNGWGIGGWGKGGGGIGWDVFKLGMGRFSWNIGSSYHPTAGDDSADDKDQGEDEGGTKDGMFPSRKVLDMNFMDGSSESSSDDDERRRRGGRRAAEREITEEFFDDDDDDYDGARHADEDGEDRVGDDEPPGPLYPGLYRALYAFEPEGAAEMRLEEDQMVRVVGRGGGVGWAVVIDERGPDGDGDGNGDEDGKVQQVKHALVPEGYLEAVRLDWEDEESEEEEGVENGDADTEGVKAGDAEDS